MVNQERRTRLVRAGGFGFSVFGFGRFGPTTQIEGDEHAGVAELVCQGGVNATGVWTYPPNTLNRVMLHPNPVIPKVFPCQKCKCLLYCLLHPTPYAGGGHRS